MNAFSVPTLVAHLLEDPNPELSLLPSDAESLHAILFSLSKICASTVSSRDGNAAACIRSPHIDIASVTRIRIVRECLNSVPVGEWIEQCNHLSKSRAPSESIVLTHCSPQIGLWKPFPTPPEFLKRWCIPADGTGYLNLVRVSRHFLQSGFRLNVRNTNALCSLDVSQGSPPLRSLG